MKRMFILLGVLMFLAAEAQALIHLKDKEALDYVGDIKVTRLQSEMSAAVLVAKAIKSKIPADSSLAETAGPIPGKSVS